MAGRPRSISEEHEKMIVTHQVLVEQRFLGIAKRCAMIKAQFGIEIGVTALKNVYQRNKIKFRQAGKYIRLSDLRTQ